MTSISTGKTGLRKRRILLLALAFFFLTLGGCQKDRYGTKNRESRKTLLMYMPWSGDLTSYFHTNISDMENSIKAEGIDEERVLVFLSTDPRQATLFEITAHGRQTLKSYQDPAFTTSEGIASILNDVKTFAPAAVYAMTIGCHGTGWLPVPRGEKRLISQAKMHWEETGPIPTRYFGGTDPKYQTDITALAEGIEEAGMKMEFILFDDCYMSSIEVAYELKEVTEYLIASPCEILAYGMPYATIGSFLFGEADYRAVCDGFYAFYSTYQPAPCGTLAVTDCSELDELAGIMKEINSRYTFDAAQRESLQRLDGYTPVLFYDYGDYVARLCDDPDLSERFEKQLERAVPYKTHTENFYSARLGVLPIRTFSGLTTSAPSDHPDAADQVDTGWYRATH